MKKSVLCLAIMFLMIIPIKAKAKEIVNQNGIVMSEETYNNLRKIFSEARVAVMDTEEFNNIINMNIDYEKVQKSIKYYKTYYDHLQRKYVNEEVLQEEYNRASTRGTSVYETTYKKLESTFVQMGTSINFLSVNLRWKIMPTVRSFDVIGTRFVHQYLIGGTQLAYQIYRKVGNSNYETISYSFNGSNMKTQNNGIAYSMNLVNDAVNHLECDLNINLSIDYFPTHVWTSYQHAISNVTLAQSQNYDFGDGLGSVFLFKNNIDQYYDGMGGLHQYQSSSSV